jgi:prolyl oligopeptidase
MQFTTLRTLITCLVLLTACKSQMPQEKTTAEMQPKLVYPATQVGNQEDVYFGTTVKDSYRQLEDLNSKETVAWVTAQNSVTFDYLNKITFRSKIKERVQKLWNFEKYSAPFTAAGLTFFYKNDGLQNQYVLYVQKTSDAQPEVLLDPNKLSDDGTVALSVLEVSKNGKYLAYAISRSGSDWQEIYVMDIASKKLLADKILWAKFSGIAWYENGFYYSRYDEPAKGREYQNTNFYHKVYYHNLHTPQSQDELVYKDDKHRERGFGVFVTEDERFLVLNEWEGTSGNALKIKDLAKKNATFQPIVEDLENDHDCIGNLGDDLLLMTNLAAPNQRLMKVNCNNLEVKNWKTVVAEQKNTMKKAALSGGKIFVTYMQDAKSCVIQYAENGTKEREIKLPSLGTAAGFEGKKTDQEVFYTFTSYTSPTTIYKYKIATGESEVFRQPTLDFKSTDYETKQVFFASKDGTKVPMFIVHKKGIALNSNNPTYLYAYGGFNISQTPSFSVKYAAWLENNGILAIPNLRGGGEYGEVWHKGGMKEKKQNVFDDFIAAAEYLIAEKYTNSSKLAIAGGSNGGLLVGATMTQRPDLCKVALPAVGVLDMLRFHRFTIGRAWISEYGCADSSKQDFEVLYNYSPLHNIKQNTAYPATLVITADHDDRVVPSHSFKFISELQAKHNGENPVLIRIDVKAGHGSGKPTSKQIEEWTDIMAFMLFNMGLQF